MNSMIHLATPAMLPALKRIWNACFGDEGGYTEYIFTNLIRPENILVAVGADGEPASMICMRPFSLWTAGREAAGAYLYGVATDPERQGKGLSTALLEECHRFLSERGVRLSALVPASESLFGFYGARGYGPFASVKKASLRREGLPASRFLVSPADPESLAGMRGAFYRDRAYVRWDAEYLRYIAGECRMLGGDALLLAMGSERGYAVCYPGENRVVVKELVIRGERIAEAAAAILDHFAREESLVYLPEEVKIPFPNKVLPFAMVRWYDKEKQSGGGPVYIAHVLDD